MAETHPTQPRDRNALHASGVLATMSQEIHTPMNAMIGAARLLLQMDLDEDQHALAEVVWKSGQAVLRLVNDACEYARVETGRLELDHIPFDLRVAMEETATQLASLAGEKGLEFDCRVHHEVPSRLQGDPNRLRQMLLGLGGSAIRSTGRGRVAVLVGWLRENDTSVTVRFLVTDTRAGLGEQPQPQGSTSDGMRGDGLGLAIVQQLAALMGGEVGFEYIPDEGGRFWFDVSLEKQEALALEPIGQPSTVELVGTRVLVVDSCQAARRTLRGKLETIACRHAEAGNAEEALAVLREGAGAGDPFHVAFIERDLPGVDGEDLGATIRADRALDLCRTVMLSTVGRRGDVGRAAGRGFSAYLPKAMQPSVLADALREVLNRPMPGSPGEPAPVVTRHSLAEARRSRTRILLVENSALNQLVARWFLTRLGYRIEIADTMAAARAAWQQTAFAIVMVDDRLPDGDPLALVRELRGHDGARRHTAIVGLFEDDSLDASLAKPVDLELLASVVARLSCTAPNSGLENEDEPSLADAGMAAGPDQGRVEVVTPDVERIIDGPEPRPARPLPLPIAGVSEPRAAAGELVLVAPAEPPKRETVSTPDRPPVHDSAEVAQVGTGVTNLSAALNAAFLSELRPRLERLTRTLNQGDAAGVEREARGLAGLSTAVRAATCVTLFTELQHRGRNGTLEGATLILRRAYVQALRLESEISAMQEHRLRA